MPPKRKAAAATGRAPKRVASGVNTPVSIDESEDDYSMGSESDPEGRAAPQKYDSQWHPAPASPLSHPADNYVQKW
jgi:alkanesulfonate monooxygenase SsuD/methylene tetrahydromethanopterin reductase-like flavin-dependent oxidoreductase (luciferase family)